MRTDRSSRSSVRRERRDSCLKVLTAGSRRSKQRQMTSESRIEIEKLDTDNYGVWRQRMKALLLSKQLWDVIDGDDEEDKKKSNQVMGLILLHVSDFHLGLADEVATAKGLWEKLEKTFKAKYNARRLLLRQQLNTLRKEPTETIPQYVARAKSIASELKAVGHEPEASEVTLPILQGLPKEYSILVTIISVAKEPPSIDDLLPMLLTTEQQVSQESEPAVPVYSAKYNGRNANRRQAQQQPGNQVKFSGKCHYCGKLGHKAKECNTRRRDQLKTPQRTVAFGASAQEVYSQDWVIDSGASRHLTADKQQLRNYRSVPSTTAVTFVNGQQAAALGQGDVHLQVLTCAGCTEVVLKGVLHVPSAAVNLTVRAVRTDRGTEYVNSELQTFFTNKGILHSLTAPYNPEQNGVAERFNRTLMEKVRAMLLDAKLGKELWAEAAKAANYVKVRSPTSKETRTPWELFTGSKPDVSGMRVFGAIAYAHVPKQLRQKLDPVSELGVFIGYEPQSKAYRVLLHTGKLQISRDVIFDESTPTVAITEAHAEAEEVRKKVSTSVPLSTVVQPATSAPPESDDGSGDVDPGPTYSTDSGEDGAAAEAESATEVEAAIPLTASLAPQPTQQRCPQRHRQPPPEIYKAH